MTRKLFLFSILLLSIPVLLLGAEKEFYVKDYFPKDISKQIIESAITQGDSVTIEKFIIYGNINKIYTIHKEVDHRKQTYTKEEGESIKIGNNTYLSKNEFEMNHVETNPRHTNIYRLLDKKFFKLTNDKKYKIITDKIKHLQSNKK